MGPTKPATPIEKGASALESAKVEFLPDEDVLDAAPDEGQGSHVGFAGPSDMPPGHPREPVAVGSPSDAGADVRISLIERRESIRHFAILVAVLAAIVASVFARPRDSSRDSVDVSPAQAAQRAAGGTESAAAASSPEGTGGSPAAGGPVTSEALEAKHASQTALEEGKTAEAIQAGERAVALDPTDAEAWLTLGASYDRLGTHEDAKRCFASCVRLATHGPRAECEALGR